MTSESPKTRVPELDGLRGLAILMVVVFHYISQEGAAPTGGVTHYLQRLGILGWSGVDLFFVLSGFLIGGILMDARASAFYYRTFCARRFFRIIPIYYLWVTAYIALIGIAGARIQALSNSGVAPPSGLPVYSYYLFLQNFQASGFAGLVGAWLGHLWSLAVEEQFYLIAPLVVRFVSSRRLPCALGVVIALALDRTGRRLNANGVASGTGQSFLLCLHHSYCRECGMPRSLASQGASNSDSQRGSRDHSCRGCDVSSGEDLMVVDRESIASPGTCFQVLEFWYSLCSNGFCCWQVLSC